MSSRAAPTPDWKDAAAYEPLLEAERALFAWEWLRRDPDYSAAAVAASRSGRDCSISDESAARWGLHVFEPPDLAVPLARPVWRREAFRLVLPAEAGSRTGASDPFDLAAFDRLARIVTSPGGEEHLLLSDGWRSIRLDLLAGSLRNGPSELCCRLCGLRGIDDLAPVLKQFAALWRSGRFAPRLHRRAPKAARWVMMLRAHDALASNATQREIADALFPSEFLTSRWRVNAPSVRSQVQRLVRAARLMARRGYGKLLQPDR